MSLTAAKKFTIALLLLAFTSQLMAAAAMTCELEKNSRESITATVTNTTPIEHSHHHHMDEMPTQDMGAMNHMNQTSQTHNHQQFDCCKTMGHCLLGACSFIATHNIDSFIVIKSRSILAVFYSSTTPSPIISSRYRPPIFC